MILNRYQQTALSGLKLVFGLVVLVALVWALAATQGCSRSAPHVDPLREEFATGEAALAGAQTHAVAALGQHVVGPTHGTSMEPLIYAGDFLVLQERAFGEVREGKVYGYLPKPGAEFPTLPADYNALPVHRAVLHDSGGFLLSGDNSPRSDSNVRLTAANLVGECVYVAHVRR